MVTRARVRDMMHPADMEGDFELQLRHIPVRVGDPEIGWPEFELRRVGPVIRTLERITDPLFRQAGLILE